MAALSVGWDPAAVAARAALADVFVDLVRAEAATISSGETRELTVLVRSCEELAAQVRSSPMQEALQRAFGALVQKLWEQLNSAGACEAGMYRAWATSQTFGFLRSLVVMIGDLPVAPVSNAIKAFFQGQSVGPSPIPHDKVLAALEWFGDEVCAGLWGLKEVWDARPFGLLEPMTPMEAAAAYGTPALISFLAAHKRVPLHTSEHSGFQYFPLCLAFKHGNVATFKQLLKLEVDVCAPDEEGIAPGIGLLAGTLEFRPFGDVQREMLALLVSTRPEIMASVSKLPADLEELAACPLTAAIISRDAAVVRTVVEAGARLRHRYEDTDHGPLPPSIVAGFYSPDFEVMKLLVELGAFEHYRSHLDADSIWRIADALADLACPFRQTDTEQALPFADLALRAGFLESWSPSGDNVLLGKIKQVLPCDDHERHVQAVVERYRAAGLNVTHLRKEDADAGRWGESLAHIAAEYGLCGLLDYAIDTCGCPVDYSELSNTSKPTPLVAALRKCRVDTALSLLSKRKVEAAYPDLPVECQPICMLLRPARENEHLRPVPGLVFTDVDLETILAALVERDPGLLNIDCFKGERVSWDPITHCVHENKPKLLELLLSQNLPGAALLATRPMKVLLHGRESPDRASPALIAASQGFWECLHVLLINCAGQRVTLRPCMRVADGSTMTMRSIEELVRDAVGAENEPSRTLITTVAARAQRERQIETLLKGGLNAAAAVRTLPSEAVASNSFEDPSLVYSARPNEEKKLAADKRRRSKRHKQVPLRPDGDDGGSGTSSAPSFSSHQTQGYSSEESEEEAFEEPDDNLVDSRYAPTLESIAMARGILSLPSAECSLGSGR